MDIHFSDFMIFLLHFKIVFEIILNSKKLAMHFRYPNLVHILYKDHQLEESDIPHHQRNEDEKREVGTRR